MAKATDMQEDDVGIHPSRVPRATLPAPPAAPAERCVALFELFRGGAGPVQLGRLQSGTDAPRLVALRRLANLPTRELEAATNRAQHVTHPKLARVLGTYQHEDAWYIASEYISGVTLFELGQTAVRNRTPVAAPVAVRIVLDALLVTAEAERLSGDSASAARCLYPESLWISDSGEIFLSELLVAPVLARITTGASYVAVTAGMSAPASDVRAAAVELARLACARLMNGNPASWQTRELPDELSELLARAVRGAEGTDTPAAFARALSALDPKLLAEPEAVQAELERLMGAERLRRHEQLETVQRQATDLDTTHVFRVANAALPDAARAGNSEPPADAEAIRRAGASTLPPPKPPSAASARLTQPTLPGSPPTPAPAVDETDSPISGVWREANLRMGVVPGRRTRRKTSHSELEAVRLDPVAAPAPTPVSAVKRSRRAWFAVLAVLALGASLAATWLSRSSSSARPSSAERVP